MGFLERLFGRKPSAPKDSGIYFYARCNHCERVLHTRLDPERELSPSESGGYEIRKEMMDDRCFRRLYLTAIFDGSKQLVSSELQGGTLIDRAIWEAEKDLPRRPPVSDSEADGDL